MLNNIKRHLSHIDLRSLFALSSGTAAAQFLPLLVAPLLYRLYSPSDYGVLAMYMAVTGLISIGVSNHYNHAVILEKHVKKALGITCFCFCVTCVVAVLSCIISGAVYYFKGDALFFVHALYYLLGVFFLGTTTLLTNWATRTAKFKLMAKARFVAAVISVVVQLIGAYIGGSWHSLISAFIISQIIMTVILYRANWSVKPRQAIIYIKISQLRESLAIHSGLVKFSLPADFLNSFIGQIPVFMLSSFSSQEVVGLYSVAKRFLILPITYITNSVSILFKQQAAEGVHKAGECIKVFKDYLKLLSVTSCVYLVVYLIFSPWAYPLILGGEWAASGLFAQALVFIHAFAIIASPLSYLFYVRNKMKEDLILHLILGGGGFAALAIGLNFCNNVVIGLVPYILIYVLVYIYYIQRSYQLAKR